LLLRQAAIPYKALLREADNRKRHVRVSWTYSIVAAQVRPSPSFFALVLHATSPGPVLSSHFSSPLLFPPLLSPSSPPPLPPPSAVCRVQPVPPGQPRRHGAVSRITRRRRHLHLLRPPPPLRRRRPRLAGRRPALLQPGAAGVVAAGHRAHGRASPAQADFGRRRRGACVWWEQQRQPFPLRPPSVV